MVCTGCKSMLGPMEGVEITGEAATVGEAIGLAAELRPDLVFMDPYFSAEAPDSLQGVLASKINVCRELKSLPEPPRVIVYAKRSSPADLAAVALAGADSYIHKSTLREEYVAAMRRIIAGEQVWVFGTLEPERANQRWLTALKVVRLSSREKEVLELLLRRYRNKEIAAVLHIRPQTATNHVSKVLTKLGYRSRDELYKDWSV